MNLPPKFTPDGKSISKDWEAALLAEDALGEYEEKCPVCEETWLFYTDLRDPEGAEHAMALEGRFFGDVWICEYCVATHDAVRGIAHYAAYGNENKNCS